MGKLIQQSGALLCLALTYLLLAGPVWGQTKTFRWTDELCEYRSTYDASKYTVQQLQNTYGLWFGSVYRLGNTPMVWRPEDVDKLDSAQITAEFQDKLQRLKTLDIVQQPYWLKLREQSIAELEAVYRLSMATVGGYKNSKALRKYPAALQCEKCAEALIAGDEQMMATWEQLSIEQCKKNGSPKMCMGRYQQERDSPQAEKYAQINLMSFGWWNCNNQSIPYVRDDGTAQTEFRKLSKQVRHSCDEP